MSYQALYRVFRPQCFAEIVGQEAIVKTLKQAIIQGKTSHAYLFTGPRGTGKTSIARIFAKAINCRQSKNGEPCNQCESCVAITKGSFEDVLEVDAASNNGVEEIRNIRETVKYSPLLADYKVYIIDEVHMLSTNAFNALLKTLEEPPERVIFILATTEVCKVLPTILSRTQRFDFKRIGNEEIVFHLEKILQELSIEYEKAALCVLARVAEGGIRDALSLLDQAISYAGNFLSLEDVLVITGSLTTEALDQYLSACFSGNVVKSLEFLTEILAQGKEAKRFLEDLIRYHRDLLMFQQVPRIVIEKTNTITDAFQQLAKDVTMEQIYSNIKCLNEAEQEIRFGGSAGIYLEIVTIKLATYSQSSFDMEEKLEVCHKNELSILCEELNQLKETVARLQDEKGSAENTEKSLLKKDFVVSDGVYKNPIEEIHQVLFSATKENLHSLKEVWDDLLASLDARQRAMMKASEPVAANSAQMVVSYDYDILAIKASQDEVLKQAVGDFLNKTIGFSPDLVIVTSSQWPNLRHEFIERNREKLQSGNIEEDEGESASLVKSVPKVISENVEIVEEAVHLFGEDFVKVIEGDR
ncbi:MAG: DNA polymerase III subunit gamma/tau [Lactobacillales bacterium]|jgi:DNA polymerase-3 subunit gamma/tau|nr:DNA polymerase III subunit gamma/tau [Lactobacillales bacterium]